ncbi:hypothetical protein J6590_071393 [Homalodisca vitripennis]|nr:hypothetical protein J6590_071393 [Homalodisca vitripennis]
MSKPGEQADPGSHGHSRSTEKANSLYREMRYYIDQSHANLSVPRNTLYWLPIIKRSRLTRQITV